MLINRVEDGLTDSQESDTEDTHDYQTASELFDIMAKKHNFQSHESDSLTTRDLILLYKNIDIGTKLMSNANEFIRSPNQYVETVIYHDDHDSESDLSEICSNEDLQNVILINKERLDLIDCPSSFGASLCHKFGDLEIHATKGYNRSLLFKNPLLDSQTNSLNLMCTSRYLDDEVSLPGSLLDYICNRRLDENYNFYMDNIIRYVNGTIDHLKRISDGEYLTEKVKEKWKEADLVKEEELNKRIVRTNSLAIPSHLEQSMPSTSTRWENVVHSEIDLKSLSKMLKKKKIVVEVPKAVCGSLRLLNKCCNDNLIITCKTEAQPFISENKKEDPRVGVVLQLRRCDSGNGTMMSGTMMSGTLMSRNNSSVMILEAKLNNEPSNVKLPLPYATNSSVNQEAVGSNVIIREIDVDEKMNDDVDENNDDNNDVQDDKAAAKEVEPIRDDTSSAEHSYDGTSEVDDSSRADHNSICQESSESSFYEGSYRNRQNRYKAAAFKTSPDELKLTIQRLSIQSSLPEESLWDDASSTFARKKSATKCRLKSPYENKSFAIEERKRKKLLEIRQRREKKKIAMTESCKNSKSNYSKGIIMAQPSNSVTKLSITNKSFYNSIYGQSMEDRIPRMKGAHKQKRDPSDYSTDTDLIIDDNDSLEINTQKYINKNYFLDEAVTEMMVLEKKEKESENQDCRSESSVSNEYAAKLNFLRQFITSSNDLIPPIDSPPPGNDIAMTEGGDVKSDTENNIDSGIGPSSHAVTIEKEESPRESDVPFENQDEVKKCTSTTSSTEFRKSIDKIYELMHKLGKGSDNKLFKSKFTAVQMNSRATATPILVPSSNASSISFDKNGADCIVDKPVNCIENTTKPNSPYKNQPASLSATPKLSVTKSQSAKAEADKNKKEHRRSATKSASDNPLKAISQLLHEFDNVQKTRQVVAVTDHKSKKHEVPAEGKFHARQALPKREIISKDIDLKNMSREKRARYAIQQQQIHDKQVNRSIKKQVSDLMDEYKEARGEAVRGPSKPSSRLNTLAQPKRIYVQAQIEDFQTRYGRGVMSDRLLRLAGPDGMPAEKNKPKRAAVSSPMKHLPPPPPPTERYKPKALSSRRETKAALAVNDKILKQHEAPDILSKKMVAVESYLKNHYGRSSTQLADSNELLRGLKKTRAPHLSGDSPVLTDDTSQVKAKNLHVIMDNLACQKSLAVLPECNETLSENSKDNMDDLLCDDFYKESLENINLNATGPPSNKPRKEKTNIKPNYTTDLKLANATEDVNKSLLLAYPDTDFDKQRFTINTYPMQQVLLLQTDLVETGDCNTAIVPSNFHVVGSKTDVFSDITSLSGYTQIDFTKLPMPIATVGYCFPHYEKVPLKSKTSLLVTPVANVSKHSEHLNGTTWTANKIDALCQCYKGNIDNIAENSVQTEPISDNVTVTGPGDETQTANRAKPQTDGNRNVTNNNLNGTEVNLKSQTIEMNATDPLQNNQEKNSDGIILKGTNSFINSENTTSSDSSNIQYTTSLDVLVGLLNEIQKITTCQTLIMSPDNHATQDFDYNSSNQTSQLALSATQKISMTDILKEYNAIQSNQKVNSQATKQLSLATFGELKRMDSTTSIRSLYINSVDTAHLAKTVKVHDDIIKPLYFDKEVSAEIPQKEFRSAFTDIPSKSLLPYVNHSTGVSKTQIGVKRESSTSSVYSFGENMSCRNVTNSLKKIIDLATEEEKYLQIDYIHKNLDVEETSPHSETLVCASKRSSGMKDHKMIVCDKKVLSADYFVRSEYDPMMKIKRDLLVTMYSVLVFTVFAALSLPEMLYRS